jgi:hypothetical protein
MKKPDLKTIWAVLPGFFRSHTYEFANVAVIAVNAVLLAAETVPSLEASLRASTVSSCSYS